MTVEDFCKDWLQKLDVSHGSWHIRLLLAKGGLTDLRRMLSCGMFFPRLPSAWQSWPILDVLEAPVLEKICWRYPLSSKADRNH